MNYQEEPFGFFLYAPYMLAQIINNFIDLRQAKRIKYNSALAKNNEVPGKE